jgi:hypothetical protein
LHAANIIAYRSFGLLAVVKHPDSPRWYNNIWAMEPTMNDFWGLTKAYAAPWTVPGASTWEKTLDTPFMSMVYFFLGVFIVDLWLGKMYWDNTLKAGVTSWEEGGKMDRLQKYVTWASPFQRLLAVIVDTIIATCIMAFFIYIMSAIEFEYFTDRQTAKNEEDIKHNIMIVGLFFGMCSVLYTAFFNGRTPGREWAKVTLVTFDGNNAGEDFWTHVMRVPLSSVLTPSLIDCLITFTGSEAASIVDTLTSTRLIDNSYPPTEYVQPVGGKNTETSRVMSKPPVPPRSKSPVSTPSKSSEKTVTKAKFPAPASTPVSVASTKNTRTVSKPKSPASAKSHSTERSKSPANNHSRDKSPAPAPAPALTQSPDKANSQPEKNKKSSKDVVKAVVVVNTKTKAKGKSKDSSSASIAANPSPVKAKVPASKKKATTKKVASPEPEPEPEMRKSTRNKRVSESQKCPSKDIKKKR